MNEETDEPNNVDGQEVPVVIATRVMPTPMQPLLPPGASPSVTGLSGYWLEFVDIDMCGQGDTEIIHDWRRHTTIDNLKRTVEQKSYSAITVSNGHPSFGHAALKKFDFQLTHMHCKPISSCCRHPCKIYIYTSTSAPSPGGWAPAPQVGESSIDGDYFSFKTGGDPAAVVDRFRATRSGNTVTYSRSQGHPGPGAQPGFIACESYTMSGNALVGPVSATVQPNGDIVYSHGYTSRKITGSVVAAPAALQAGSGKVALSGWSGYNARLNGVYTPNGESVNGKPVFSHATHEGVGGGHDWCRMWYAHGAWRIGHFSWVHGDNELAVAYVKSGATHPSQIEPRARWLEHKGTGAGRDFGQREGDFKHSSGVRVAEQTLEDVAEQGVGGTIEFLGLWKDAGNRAMPIKMGVNPSQPNQIRDAFQKLVAEMRQNGASSGILAAQSYNQMHWSANPGEQGYQKHGYIGNRPEHATRSTWSGREHRYEGMRFDGFTGAIDILGGDWQNAVYRVTLSGGGGSSASSSAGISVKGSSAGISVKHTKPGPRLTYADSEAYARKMDGRLLTLDEAREFMKARGPLYPGEDQWCAVQGRDWMQVGNRHHHPGKSHNLDCGHYPPWGDDANNKTYGDATWNYVVLYTARSHGHTSGPIGGGEAGSLADIVPVVVGVPVPAQVQMHYSAREEPSQPFYIPAEDMAGCWTCACIPLGCACFQKTAEGSDRLVHKGCAFCLFALPVPFVEPRVRVPGTNGFYKEDEGPSSGNVDRYHSSRFVCNGVSCSVKLW
jgi:hypothetical protein